VLVLLSVPGRRWAAHGDPEVGRGHLEHLHARLANDNAVFIKIVLQCGRYQCCQVYYWSNARDEKGGETEEHMLYSGMIFKSRYACFAT